MSETLVRENYQISLCEKCLKNESTTEIVLTDNTLIYVCNSC